MEMYDVNGNKFFENCASKQEAENLIKKLRKKGKIAVIGPRAPINIYGEKINYENDDVVGVYIAREREEKVNER